MDSKKKTSIRDFLPKKDDKDFTYIQVRIPKELVGQVKLYMRKDGCNLEKVIEACFKAYVAEAKDNEHTAEPLAEKTEKSELIDPAEVDSKNK